MILYLIINLSIINNYYFNFIGPALDAFARLPLWKAGLNYRHGTGHGVGAFLNVHEGMGVF